MKRLTRSEEMVLLRVVNAVMPFTAVHGEKHARWVHVASRVSSILGCPPGVISDRLCRDVAHRLLKTFQEKQQAAPNETLDPETMDERDRLCSEIQRKIAYFRGPFVHVAAAAAVAGMPPSHFSILSPDNPHAAEAALSFSHALAAHEISKHDPLQMPIAGHPYMSPYQPSAVAASVALQSAHHASLSPHLVGMHDGDKRDPLSQGVPAQPEDPSSSSSAQKKRKTSLGSVAAHPGDDLSSDAAWLHQPSPPSIAPLSHGGSGLGGLAGAPDQPFFHSPYPAALSAHHMQTPTPQHVITMHPLPIAQSHSLSQSRQPQPQQQQQTQQHQQQQNQQQTQQSQPSQQSQQHQLQQTQQTQQQHQQTQLHKHPQHNDHPHQDVSSPYQSIFVTDDQLHPSMRRSVGQTIHAAHAAIGPDMARVAQPAGNPLAASLVGASTASHSNAPAAITDSPASMHDDLAGAALLKLDVASPHSQPTISQHLDRSVLNAAISNATSALSHARSLDAAATGVAAQDHAALVGGDGIPVLDPNSGIVSASGFISALPVSLAQDAAADATQSASFTPPPVGASAVSAAAVSMLHLASARASTTSSAAASPRSAIRAGGASAAIRINPASAGLATVDAVLARLIDELAATVHTQAEQIRELREHLRREATDRKSISRMLEVILQRLPSPPGQLDDPTGAPTTVLASEAASGATQASPYPPAIQDASARTPQAQDGKDAARSGDAATTEMDTSEAPNLSTLSPTERNCSVPRLDHPQLVKKPLAASASATR
ncbi:hypothetical protein HK105_202797 [Polyrhizophydium stewartii]|uniref:Uncharacterized protein n=1 Tax=Polyrhizophydium stewartii TaxID=2732419 RepID=A0ABR4NDD6_9FUNG